MTSTMLCPDGITFATLAAWHDGTLSDAEAARVGAHVAGCAACRAELSALEMQDGALRRLHAPEPDGRLVRAARGYMRGERPARRIGPSSRRIAGGLGAVAAVLLVALGFAQVFRERAQPSANTTPSVVAGTPTLLPTAIAASPAVSGPRPSWQQGTLPVASLTDQDILSFGVVPTDGNEAYACFGTSDRSGSTLTFYRTNDRSLHWTTQTQITVPSLDLSECMVQVDALDANRVLIEVTGQNTGTLNEVTSYEYTDNGGATWRQLTYSEMIYSPATFAGATYAMQYPSLDAPGGITHLSVSTDGLQSWEPIDQAFSSPSQTVDNFWLNPDGELLVAVTSGIVVATATPSGIPTAPAQQHLTLSLWQSSDGGAHWEQIPTPRFPDGALGQDIVVQQPTAGEPWHMCERYGSQHGTSPDAVACTFDGGKSWSARPWLCLAAVCTLQPQSGDLDVMASDGALLVMDQVPGNQSQSAIYRLPQGSTTWQSLGPISGSNAYFYAPTSNGGILWTYAGGMYDGRLSGIIGGQQLLPGVIATATYP